MEYRIYDKTEKRWREDVVVLPNGRMIRLEIPMTGRFFTGLDESRFVIVRFTGLHDQNGEKIWEWDEVKFEYDGLFENKTVHAVVEHGDLGFWLECTEYGVALRMEQQYETMRDEESHFTRLGSSLEGE